MSRYFLILATLLFVAPAVLAAEPAAAPAEAAARARELLALSERQNVDDHALALRTAREALALYQTTGDVAGLARAHRQIAVYLYVMGDLPEAIQHFEEALRRWQELGDTREQADTLILLGFSDARRGEWPGGITFLTRAQGLVDEEAEPAKMGQIVSGLAYIFNESGLPESGLEHYRRALDFYRRTPETRDDTLTLLALGGTYRQLGDYPEALNHLYQALALAAPPGGIDAAFCHLYLGMVYISTGDAQAAHRHQRIALPILTKAGNPKEAAQVVALIGHAHQLEGREEAARRHYRQALAVFTRLSDRINQAAVYYALGVSQLRAGDFEAAERDLRQSLEVTENIRRTPASSDLTAAFSATVHERYEKYVECLMRRHAAEPGGGHDVRAFETSELARARSLAEMLRATQTNVTLGLDPQLAEQEKSLRQALRLKENERVKLLSRKYEKQELTALDADSARLEADYRQVSETIRARHPAFEQVTRPTAWDLRSIREQVVADDQTVLIEYGLGERRSYVWAVTRDRLVTRELPPRAVIDAAAGKVYRLLSAPPGAAASDELATAARELGQLVLAPIADELNQRRVIVVADGALHYIPFQMLPVRGDEPLIADCEVVNAPSASILGELRQEAARRQPPARTLAAFGDPVFASNYAQRRSDGRGEELAAVQPTDPARLRHDLRDIELSGDAFDPAAVTQLFYAGRELAHLAEVAAGGEPLVASDFEASRERLLGADLSQYAVLHFATHGFLDPRRPENSGLVLSTVDVDGRAREGFVGLRHIYALRAPVDLVVLSACRTALGKDVRGEGLLGMTRAFMYAGASGVVSSLWKVDDEATAELMRRFYTNMLRDGMSPAAALRAAQNDIRQRPEWRAPYYWAAFTLQGEYRQVIRPRPAAASGRMLVWAGGVLLALSGGAAAWYFRRRAVATRR